MERVEPENTEQQDLADQWKELCELSMPEGEKVLEAVKNFLEYEESCGKVLKKESEELKKQSETLRMLIQKKAEKNKIFDRLEMEEKQLSILNAKQEEMETCRVQAVLGHRAEQARHLEVQALRTAKSVRQIQGEIEQITVWQKEQEKELSEVKEKCGRIGRSFCKGRTGNAEKKFHSYRISFHITQMCVSIRKNMKIRQGQCSVVYRIVRKHQLSMRKHMRNSFRSRRESWQRNYRKARRVRSADQ